MIVTTKNAFVDYRKPVRVYRNIHKQKADKNERKWYTIVQDRKVVGHCTNILLEDVVCTVSESGRQRVLKTGQKNVHAYITGMIKTTEPPLTEWMLDYKWALLDYKPRTRDSFTAEFAYTLMDGEKIFYKGEHDVSGGRYALFTSLNVWLNWPIIKHTQQSLEVA